MKNVIWVRWLGKFWLAIFFAVSGLTIANSGNRVLAQITPDGTLGVEGSIVNNGTINGLPVELIEGGASRGAALFHSFFEFNVGEGQRVYFANPVEIESIFSRVTGNNPSDILGTLGVNGGANLFLLNPNGIVFGQNAQLDIRGSFVASTADGLVFDNGFVFSARNPDVVPLLTVNLMPGLQYGANDSPQSSRLGGKIITTNNTSLAVGQNLTLAARNLDLQGELYAGNNLTLFAQDTVEIRDSVVNPFIAKAGEKLLIQGNQSVDIFALNHSDSGLFSGGDMVLRSSNTVAGDAHYWSGGSFQIEQLDGSLGDLDSPNDPIIRSVGDVRFNNYQGASLHILAGGSVTIPGTVRIRSRDPINGLIETVTLSNGGTSSINGRTQATVDIRAGVKPSAIGISGFTPNPPFGTNPATPAINVVPTSADIMIGRILTNATGRNGGRVLLTNQYQPNTLLDTPLGGIIVGSIDTRDVFGGGSVIIDSRSGITLSDVVDASSLDLSVAGFPVPSNTYLGNGGEVTLLAKGDITINPNSPILSLGLLGGNILLKSEATISLSPGGIASASFTNVPDSKGGDINVIAESLFITDGAQIITFTTGRANAGNLNINGIDTVSMSGVNGSDIGGVHSTVEAGANANSGNVNITAGSLSLNNGARVQTIVHAAQGNAGLISINVRDAFALDGINGQVTSGVASILGFGATGKGGDINITTGSLAVTNGAQLQASTFGQGDGGKVKIEARDLVSFDGLGRNQVPSGAGSNVAIGAVGNSGGIDITTSRLTVTNGAQLQASTSGRGSAGPVIINAQDMVSFDGQDIDGSPSSGIFSNVNAGGVGSSGGIDITTGRLMVTNGAQLQASTLGRGNASEIRINARETVSFDRSSAFSTVEAKAVGDGGGINITTGILSVSNGAQLMTNTRGQGNGGKITINADEIVSFDGVGSNGIFSGALSTVEAGAVGKGGEIEITTRSLFVTNGGQLDTSTFGRGDAGRLIIDAHEMVSFDGNSGAFSQVSFGAVGKGGDIDITTGSLSLTHGGQLSTSTLGLGNAGHVTIDAREAVSFDGIGSDTIISGAFSAVGQEAIGNGGEIDIMARSLSVTNKAQILASTLGQGDGGRVTIQSHDLVYIDRESGVNSRVEVGGVGIGGDIDITTGALSITNRSQLSTSTLGQGNAGTIEIDASEIASFDRESSAFSSVGVGAVGRGGAIDIITGSLFITNGSQLSTSTFGQGDAGQVAIVARDRVSFDGLSSNGFSSSALSLVGSGALGNGGDIDITADSLAITNGSEVSTDTLGEGSAGRINLNAHQVNVQSGSRVSAATSGGKGGTIRVTANTLEATNSGQLSTTTAGNNDAGDIILEVKDNIDLTGKGSGLFANTLRGSTGNGGIIFIDTITGNIQDNATVAVNSQGTGEGGNIEIEAASLFMNNGATITAETTSNEGGNITLNIDNWLFMRHGSKISTTAGTDRAGGNGGNITINAPFIVGIREENSDITANAFKGNGGRINLTAQSIVGLEFRPRLTRFSDITASSELGLDGVVDINLPDVDPSRGLNQLLEPQNPRQIEQGCPADENKFTVTGSGGLPQQPDEALRTEAIIPPRGTNSATIENFSTPVTSKSTRIVEAKGWVINERGEVVLVADAPTLTSSNLWWNTPQCHEY